MVGKTIHFMILIDQALTDSSSHKNTHQTPNTVHPHSIYLPLVRPRPIRIMFFRRQAAALLALLLPLAVTSRVIVSGRSTQRTD